MSAANPGFPIGGAADPFGGGTDLRCGHFSAETYAKTKELGPVGGGGATGAPWIRHCMCSVFFSVANILCEISLPIINDDDIIKTR